MGNEISANNLVNLLHAYAVEDPSMTYCQGMNFMAGFLFLNTRSESKSFILLKHIIQKYQMTELFDTSTPKLKMMFYRMDRLISIIQPDMHLHFKVSASPS
jgi:hypothetical protein